MTIQGTVHTIRYCNPENAWAAINLKLDKKSDGKLFEDQTFVSATGIMPGLRLGMTVRLNGNYEMTKYGQSFKTTSFEETRPSDIEGIYKYLSSGLIKNIGPVFARKIVTAFGEQTLEILDENPERLREISGIGKKRIDAVIEAVKDQKAIRTIMIWLKRYDLPNGIATKIFKEYGDKAITILETNPYKLADNIKGVGFKKADDVARRIGLPEDSDFRIMSGLKACLEDNAVKGNTYVDREQLIADTASPDYLDLDTFKVEAIVDDPLKFLSIGIIENDKVMLKRYYYAELIIAERLKAISYNGKKAPTSFPDIYRIEKENNVTYSEQQCQAITLSIQSSLFIMTGGPGTGKTTTTKAIINECEHRNLNVLLAAPTGRAAKRMTESTGRPAKTIHRLLEYKQGIFTRNESNPINAQVIIIDEASMIDTMLMRDMLKAVSDKTKLIIVGDIDQLPSIGAGCVLKDIIESGQFPLVRLTEIYRQGRNSNIIMNAHQVNKGLMPYISNADEGQKKNDFWFFKIEDRDKIADTIIDLVKNKVPQKFGFKYEDIQVLSPMRRESDPIGSIQLNLKIQEAINPNGQKAATRGATQFRVGDRIMQTKNNYDKDIFNGDIGTVSAKLNGQDEDKAVMEAIFDGHPKRFSQEDLNEIELAYACTVHKSQGSEYPVIIMPVHTSHFIMLKRNLVYTGITRAKKQCILVGTMKALGKAVHTEDTERRQTLLKQRIKESFSII